MVALKRELERLRDQVSSNDVKVKWMENKMKAEVESHKVRVSLPVVYNGSKRYNNQC